MYTVYGIPNCDTVKKALTWLKVHQITFVFHDYKKQGISEATLLNWLEHYPWEELVNRNGTTWRQRPEDQRPSDTPSAVAFMLTNTSAIRRPIITKGSIVAIGFNEKNYEGVFNQAK